MRYLSNTVYLALLIAFFLITSASAVDYFTDESRIEWRQENNFRDQLSIGGHAKIIRYMDFKPVDTEQTHISLISVVGYKDATFKFIITFNNHDKQLKSDFIEARIGKVYHLTDTGDSYNSTPEKEKLFFNYFIRKKLITRGFVKHIMAVIQEDTDEAPANRPDQARQEFENSTIELFELLFGMIPSLAHGTVD
jgi:hypothetical protein